MYIRDVMFDDSFSCPTLIVSGNYEVLRKFVDPVLFVGCIDIKHGGFILELV